MKKLFTLKEWLSLEEASTYLSACLCEPVSAADVVRLAIDGHLVVSVYFVNPVYARRGVLVPNDGSVCGGIPFNSREILVFDNEVTRLSGVYDLPMNGGEVFDCEHKYQKLVGGPIVMMGEARGAFVRESNSNFYFAIQQYCAEMDENFNFGEARYQLEKWWWKGRLFDDFVIEYQIEKGADLRLSPSREDVFVVRSSALREFLEAVQPAKVERPIATRERNTLLSLVAVLCKIGNLDVSTPAKTAGVIRSAAIEMGMDIGETTIEGKLKAIPAVVGSRLK